MMPSNSVDIYALHGFLGNPRDWNPFKQINYPVEIKHEGLDLWNWSKQFNAGISRKQGTKNILLGYSLGGRLAMHVLLADPILWDGVIFVSAHPGLVNLEDKMNRLEFDRRWAKRFAEEPWELVIQDWNASPVFAGVSCPMRRFESDYNRKVLVQHLKYWSLGTQDDLSERLKKIKVPMLYIAGEHDEKYNSIANSFKSFAEVIIVPEAGHRVPWEAPDTFSDIINQFIKVLP